MPYNLPEGAPAPTTLAFSSTEDRQMAISEMLCLADGAVQQDELIHRLMNEDLLVPVVAMTVGGVIAVVAIVFTTVRAMAVSRNREATRREIAAYVAEGSIDPDKAIAMLEADKPVWEKDRKGGSRGA